MEPILGVALLYIFPVFIGNWIARHIPSDEIVWAWATHKLYIMVSPDHMQNVLTTLSLNVIRTTDITPWGNDQIILLLYTPERHAVNRQVRIATQLSGVQSVVVHHIRKGPIL